ncbi:MAG: DUF3800 domain-containing protein [Syntrophomonadaceae bacterium]|nr:DUF3800 domain-containing protein [Syntrophomonadaceae bacterium]
MLAIFLDESGIFEKVNEHAQLNAGLVYKGENLEPAIKNLQTLLEQICFQHRLTYPEGLHGSEIKNLKLRRQIQHQILEFLGHNKDWAVIGIVAGDFIQDERSNIIDERQASNLYRNMLMRLLDNAIYYSPLAQGQKKAQLHIASRIAVIDKRDRERQSQYAALGYNRLEHRDKNNWCYPLIDEPVISAALSQLYEERENFPQLDFQLFVQNIYKAKNVGLMAADLICNWIFGNIDPGQADRGLNNICTRLHSMGLNSYLWTYDQVDDKWREVYELAESTDIYSCLAQRLRFNRDANLLHQYYQEHFTLPEINVTADTLEAACHKANNTLKGNNVEYHLEEAILQEILDLASLQLPPPPPLIFYYLYDLLLRTYNHLGEPDKAIEYGEKALKQLDLSPRSLDNMERRLETLNRMSVTETNRFNFEAAVLLLEKDLVPRLAKRLQLEDDGSGPPLDPVLGKCYSSLGQNYAFLGRNKKALQAFQRALEHFATNPWDIEITTAHILQLALATDNRELFDEYASGYFGELPGQNSAFSDSVSLDDDNALKYSRQNTIPAESLPLQYCRAGLNSNNPFKLFILVKYINVYDKWRENQVIEILLNTDYKAVFGSTNHHPWELIYRHLAEIAFKAGYEDAGRDWAKQSLSVGSPTPSLTFRVLHLGTGLMAAYYCCKGKQLKQAYQETLTALQEICASEEGHPVYHPDNQKSWFYGCVKNAGSKSSVRKKVQRFIGRFTFEYR